MAYTPEARKGVATCQNTSKFSSKFSLINYPRVDVLLSTESKHELKQFFSRRASMAYTPEASKGVATCQICGNQCPSVGEETHRDGNRQPTDNTNIHGSLLVNR